MSGERLWSLHARGPDGLSAGVVRWTSATLLGLLAAAALLLVARRLAGALSRPLDTVPLLAVAAVMAIVVLVIRLSWPIRSSAGSVPRNSWLAMAAVSLAAAAFGVAVSARGTNVLALAAFWALLAVEEAWAWRRILKRPAAAAPPRPWRLWRRDRPELPAPHTARTSAPWPAAQLPKRADALPPDDVLQHLVRSRAANGIETLSGFARIIFAPGQRTGSIHLAFCPPFARTPELSMEQIDGPEARIKTAQLLPYGARLDLKLAAEADRHSSVLLQFVVRSDEETPEG